MDMNDLIAPHTMEAFIDAFWEREAVHVCRSAAGYYDDLLSASEVEGHLFATHRLSPGPFKVYRGNEEIAAREWICDVTVDGGVISVVDNEKMRGFHRAGYSIFLGSADQAFPRLNSFLARVERDWRVRCVSHLMVSPPNSPGFPPHTDPYGVFTLQICGAKMWSVYGTQDYPPANHGIDQPQFAGTEPTRTYSLEAGDLLYLPRGMAHSAATAGEASIHLALALIPPRGADVLGLLAAAAEDHAFFRRYVPYGIGDENRQDYANAFAARVAHLIEDVDLFDLLDRRHAASRRKTDP